MAKNYVQLGENITVPVESTVDSGDFVIIGGLYGVALTDAKTDDGTNYYTVIATKGVWEITGVTGLSQGDPVAVSGTNVGVAIEDSGDASTYVLLVPGANASGYVLPAASAAVVGGVKLAAVVAAVAAPDATVTASGTTVDPAEFAAVVALANECKAKLNLVISGAKTALQMAAE